jgi:hypothetical protein
MRRVGEKDVSAITTIWVGHFMGPFSSGIMKLEKLPVCSQAITGQ